MPKIVDHEERRRHIVAALWRVVETQGASAVSTRSVAAEAGMSKSNLATYVGTQGQLLALATQDLVGGVSQRILAMDLFSLNVDVATDALLEGIPLSPRRRIQSQVWLLLLTTAATQPELSGVLGTLNFEVRSGIETILTAMRNQGLYAVGRDISADSALLHALVDGLSLQILSSGQEPDVPAVRGILRRAVADLANPALSPTAGD